MIEEMKQDLPEGIKTVFFSSVAQLGLTELKDVLWEQLTEDME
jgi:GTP-binding protein